MQKTRRDADSIPGSRRSPGEGNGNPLQLFLPGKFHAQRSLAGHSPWGHKESDMTEYTHIVIIVLSPVQQLWILPEFLHVHLYFG